MSKLTAGKLSKIVLFLILALLLVSGFIFSKRYFNQKPNSHFNSPAVLGDGEQFGITGLYGEEEYALAAKTGAKWIRPQLVWNNVQKQGQSINFEKLDELYNQSQKYGFKIIFSLRTGHQQPWPTKCDLKLCQGKKECPNSFSSCPPADFNEYRDFVFALASHFKGKIEYFNLENEVNTLTFWNGTAEDYLKLRKTAYEAIHAANPQAVVLDNGIASEAWIEIIARDKFCKEGKEAAKNFLLKASSRRYQDNEQATEKALAYLSCQANGQPTLDRGSEIINAIFTEPESFDALSFHYYESYQLLDDVIGWIKNKMASQGYSKPLYLTEGGYYDSLMSPKDQTALNLVAYDVVKLHATAFGEGVKLFIWLPGVQKNSEGIPKPYQGLYAENRRLLPSGDAYQILISKIGGFSDFGQIALKKEVSAYEVVVNQKKLIIAWADSPTTMSIDTLPFKATQVTDYLGQTVNISNGVLNLTDRPFYIE